MSKNLSLKVVLAFACLALAIMACSAVQVPSLSGSSGPGNTNSSSTNTNTNTSSDSNSNSNVNSGGSTSGGDVLLSDDFSDDQSGWGTGTDANSLVEYVNGGLQMTVYKDNYFTYSVPNQTAYQNVHIEVTIANNSSDKVATFGIMCNQQVTKDAFYYFGISPNGEYAIVKAAVAKDDQVLTNKGKWKSSNLVKVNAKSYTLGADCGSDGTLTMYVDGQKVDSVTDTSYGKGRVALFAWNAKVPSGTDVTFDNFTMTSLK
jgi:hypothetical protein